MTIPCIDFLLIFNDSILSTLFFYCNIYLHRNAMYIYVYCLTICIHIFDLYYLFYYLYVTIITINKMIMKQDI